MTCLVALNKVKHLDPTHHVTSHVVCKSQGAGGTWAPSRAARRRRRRGATVEAQREGAAAEAGGTRLPILLESPTLAHQSSWTLPLPNTLLLLPDPELLPQNASVVQPTTLDSPCIPALPQDLVPPFVHAPRLPSLTSRRDAAVALITCVLVVIIGSLSNPIFVTIDSEGEPAGGPHPACDIRAP